MTDEEYRALLNALAQKFLRPVVLADPETGSAQLARIADRLAGLYRFTRAIADYDNDSRLTAVLAEKLREADPDLDTLFRVIDRSGVLDALEDANHVVFLEMRRSAIPEEDVYILRRAGCEDPEGEITLIIRRANHFYHYQGAISDIPAECRRELKKAAESLEAVTNVAPESDVVSLKPRRKLFNGIGKILAGTVTAAGNLLLLTGSIVGPNPATAYGVIASSALAIASMGQGIGDLRGE